MKGSTLKFCMFVCSLKISNHVKRNLRSSTLFLYYCKFKLTKMRYYLKGFKKYRWLTAHLACFLFFGNQSYCWRHNFSKSILLEKAFTFKKGLKSIRFHFSYNKFFWTKKKNFTAPFYRQGSTVTWLQSHYEKIVYFQTLPPKEILIPTWSTLVRWKLEATLEHPNWFVLETPR